MAIKAPCNLLGRTVFITTLLGLLCSAAAPAAVTLEDRYAQLTINPVGGSVKTWQLCRRDCDHASGEQLWLDTSRPVLRISSTATELDQRLQTLRYQIIDHNPQELELLSEPLPANVRLRQRYQLRDDGRRLELRISLTGPGASAFVREHPLQLQVATGGDFARRESAGFTGWAETVRWLSLVNKTVHSESAASAWQTTADWVGLRNRFWTLLVQQPGETATVRGLHDNSGYTLTVTGTQAAEQRFHIFAGPLEPAVLARQQGHLQKLWIAGLWDWLRWIALGLYYLLESLYKIFGHYGLAIIVLALAVKILMLPLTAIAGRWQHQVTMTQANMRPALQRIKAESRGEDQARQVIALHREFGVTPFYPIKSLFGVLIQLPVFIGAFDMLLHHPGLAGADFLWVHDLARPDQLLALPFVLPFFGGHLNLLPFLMTAINLLAAARQSRVAAVDAHDHRQRQRWLYGMALLFLVLFYTFPAGMVLYWTSTNLFYLLGEIVLQRYRTGSSAGAAP